ncbi:MAG: ATP-binding cassette domain-containing protein [Caldilineaceae bacterium]
MNNIAAGRVSDRVPIRTEGLTRVVDGKRLVDNVSISVNEGETFVIVGASGAGKSSLLRLINRLDEPTEGTVYLDGQNYRDIPPTEVRRRVGLVMQAPNLFPGTVADNVRYGPRIHGETLSDADLDSLLERVDLDGYASRAVEKLSGGEAQRVSLARTLANRPEVLLLDEPTSALDDVTKQEVESVIFEIIRARSLTCLFVTHDTEQARRVADRIMYMEAGRISRIGAVEEVLDAR